MFPNPNRLSHDFVLSGIAVILISSGFRMIFVESIIDANQLNLFITLFIGIMGVLITILTLLFAFEDTFSKNEAIKILKERNEYNQIYKRFVDSSFGLLYSIIVLSL